MTPTNPTPEDGSLRACPFCGGEDVFKTTVRGHQGYCRTCGSETGYYPTPAAARAAWNRLPDRIAALEEALREIGKFVGAVGASKLTKELYSIREVARRALGAEGEGK